MSILKEQIELLTDIFKNSKIKDINAITFEQMYNKDTYDLIKQISEDIAWSIWINSMENKL